MRIGGGMVVDVMRLAVFGGCSRFFLVFLVVLVDGYGCWCVEMGDEKRGESLSYAQTTSII